MERPTAPDASVYRLSLYHCYLGELLRAEGATKVTSRQLARELGIKEETVRRDMSFIGGVGRPGSGYDAELLFATLTEFLGLSEEYPIVKVGSAEMLSALRVVFPAQSYGVKPVAYFSELPDDVGKVIDGVEVRSVTEIPDLDPGLDVTVALVACSPAMIDQTLSFLDRAGVTGVLLLTPAIRVVKPEGMELSQIRMPCDIKSLACHCRLPVVREVARD